VVRDSICMSLSQNHALGVPVVYSALTMRSELDLSVRYLYTTQSEYLSIMSVH
jgi:hypothetical protein